MIDNTTNICIKESIIVSHHPETEEGSYHFIVIDVEFLDTKNTSATRAAKELPIFEKDENEVEIETEATVVTVSLIVTRIIKVEFDLIETEIDIIVVQISVIENVIIVNGDHDKDREIEVTEINRLKDIKIK